MSIPTHRFQTLFIVVDVMRELEVLRWWAHVQVIFCVVRTAIRLASSVLLVLGASAMLEEPEVVGPVV